MLVAKLRVFWLSLLCLFAVGVLDGRPVRAAIIPVPVLTQPLQDEAHILSATDAELLNQQLLAWSQKRGSQFAVLILPTTGDEDIFTYSYRVAKNWQLGRKGKDDGLLLVIAFQDRKTHLQVGYGLEGAVPDILVKQTLQDTLKPKLQAGNFAGGIQAVIERVTPYVDDEKLAVDLVNQESHNAGSSALIVAGVFGFFFGKMFTLALGRLFGGLGVAGTVGGIAFLLFGLGLGTAILAGVIAAFASLMPLSLLNVVSSGGWSSSGRGGFGGGGGGFSGGGGSFGGGGASGDW